MLIGVPKEVKNHEYRVGLLPAAVKELISHGHEVMVETNAGAGIGFSDDAYCAAGATLASTPAEVFANADMIVKVKEPLAEERTQLRPGQVLFTYLHLAPDLPQTLELVESGATCIAYETVTDRNGRLPLLAPMSAVAGRLAVQAGATCLEKVNGGSGILLGGIPGTSRARVVVLGGGVVGFNATQMAVGLGAKVTVIDRSLDVLERFDRQFGNRVQTLYSTTDTVAREVEQSDLVIGAVLIPGASAPKLVTREMLASMKAGSVLVDVAIDQGGCFETSRATTHADPTYELDGIIHYCVANMPGAVARTSAVALGNATLPFVLALADEGAETAMRRDPCLSAGLNVYQGQLTNEQVGMTHGLDHASPATVLAA